MDSSSNNDEANDEITLEDSGATSLGESDTSGGVMDSIVLSQSVESKSDDVSTSVPQDSVQVNPQNNVKDEIQEDSLEDSIQFNSINLNSSGVNNTRPTEAIDLNESISVIEPPNSVYIDTNDPSIIDLSNPQSQEVVFGQYGDHGTIPSHVWKRRLDKQFKPLKEFKVSINSIFYTHLFIFEF